MITGRGWGNGLKNFETLRERQKEIDLKLHKNLKLRKKNYKTKYLEKSINR